MKAFYPLEDIKKITKDPTGKTKMIKKFEVKKLDKEIRVVSMDIAYISDRAMSIISCFRAIESEKKSKKGKSEKYYKRELSYMTAMMGKRYEDQALQVRRICESFGADYLVMDTNGLGLGVYENLAKELYDPLLDKMYSPWKAMNHPDLANKADPGAIAKIYALMPNPQINQECLLSLKQAIGTKNISFLCDSLLAKENLIKRFKNFPTMNPEQRALLVNPYAQTDELLNEMIQLSLKTSTQGTNSYMKVTTSSKKRKDRYSAVSYGNWYIDQLEKQNFSSDIEEDLLDFICIANAYKPNSY